MKRWYVVSIFTILLLVLWFASFRYSSVIVTTREGALAALDQIQEWSKWMTGIQTAALAVLVYIAFVKDSVRTRMLPDDVWFFVLKAFVFLGSALLCSSWIFSSLSSNAIRIHSVVLDPMLSLTPEFDIYESPAFGWTPDWLTLGYLLSVAHWLWVIGLVSLGVAIGRLVLMDRPSENS